MKKEIFDSLVRISTSQVNSGIPTTSPAVQISGELAFCLDTLMNNIGPKMNISPESIMEKILETGIDNWLGQMTDETKHTIGLSKPAIEEDFEDDPDMARAQQAAYAQMTESYGYTPLTAHSMNGNGTRSDSRGSSARKNTKKKKVRASGKKHPPKRTTSRRRRYGVPKQGIQ